MKPITVITRDNIRKLRPKQKQAKQSNHAIQIDANSLLSIEKSAVFKTDHEMTLEKQKAALLRQNNHKIASERKKKMESFDQKRLQNSKLSDLEEEARQKAKYLLAKAQMQIEEQEDEIKHMNELMLYAKCKYVQNERKKEEQRLDEMMEFERVNELKKLDEKEQKRVAEMRKGAAIIRQQIEERREAALLEQERRDQETKAIIKQIRDNFEQEKKEKAEKIKSQRMLLQDVAIANQASMETKKREKLLEEEEDKKVLNYLLEKAKREEENERLLQRKKQEREIELARLRAAQEKASDKQAAQDALRSRRAYEAYEREWRRKEKEQAEKSARMEEELRRERIKQQQAREEAIAVEAHKNKIQFFATLARQEEEDKRIKAEQEERALKNKKYALEQQIREKEEHRRKERIEFFQEGIRLAKDRNEKKSKLDAIKSRKIQELKTMGVPSKYCNEIERQVHAKKPMFSV